MCAEAGLPPYTAEMDDLLDRIVRWGTADGRVRALVLTGSRARADADALSDYDVAVFATDPTALASADRWYADLGPMLVCLPLSDDTGNPTRLVIYDGGQKVDFSLLPVAELAALAAADPLPDPYDRGYRVLLDKDGLAGNLPPAPGPAPAMPPTPAAFIATVEEFWFEVWHVAKYLARGDLWHAKFRDWTTKEMLLRMVEWHAVACLGATDVHYLGLGMAGWADPDAWRRLHHTFGHFDAADARAALLATAALFGDLARAVAPTIGASYPQPLEDAVLAYAADVFPPHP